MKIATWNVNSIRARLERVKAWLASAEPDVLCLQEIKVRDEDFPADEFEALGYYCAVHGQPTYNGVAILARGEVSGVVEGLSHEDEQARLISADIDGVKVVSVYVPNGAEVGSEKYAYKIGWLDDLERFLADRSDPSEPLAVCGDYNIARDELDVNEPESWQGSVLFNEELSARLQRLLDWGLVDTVRESHPDGGVYSWWDYRRLAFPRNDGLRIDHILATASLADSCTEAYVERDERKGEKPSDHVPVVAVFDL